MENFSYHVPFYVVTNGVATQGYTSDLIGGQVGVFDRQTWAVATGNGSGKELFFSQGATGGKGFYGEPVSASHKSPTFFTKDVINIYKSLPAKLQNEEWIVGYDGSASSKSLEFVKGKKTGIDLYFHGEPTYRLFNGPKEFSVSYTPPIDCTTDCASDCDGTRQDPKPHAIQLVNYINNFIELQKLGVRAKLVESTYSAATATKQKYTLVIFDTVDTVALTKVKAEYPGTLITRIKTDGAQSTYEIILPIGASAPADFTYDGGFISLAVCGVCPTGFTSVSLPYAGGDSCVSPAGSTVAWVIGATGVSGTRVLKIKLKRPDCNASGTRVADIQAALTGMTSVVGTSGVATVTTIAGTACIDEYTVTQVSDDFLTEGCLTSEVSFTFISPLPAIDGISWNEQLPVITADPTRKVGIRISAGYYDPKFGNCSFDPYDYYETMPLKMEVTGLIETSDNCAFASAPTSTQTKNARFSRQSGEYVIREVIMKSEAYLKHADQWDANPRMRDAFDMQIQNMIDRNAFYTLWYINYEASYNPTSRSSSKPKFTTVFAFKENDPKLLSFETNVINVVAQKAGITPHVNS